MTSWRVHLLSGARRSLRALPKGAQRRVTEELVELSRNPVPSGAILLRGTVRDYRITVGKYRVIYRLGTKSILVVRIERRGDETYRHYNPRRKRAT